LQGSKGRDHPWQKSNIGRDRINSLKGRTFCTVSKEEERRNRSIGGGKESVHTGESVQGQGKRGETPQKEAPKRSIFCKLKVSPKTQMKRWGGPVCKVKGLQDRPDGDCHKVI